MGWRAAALAVVAAAGLAAAPATAQEQPDRPPRSPVLTLNYDVLIAASSLGQRLSGDLEAERIVIDADNRRIAEELEAEEVALTEQRDGMTPEAFRAAARAFDEKVQNIRAERRALELELAQRRDTLRQEFDRLALPVLSDIMREAGAGVLMDARSVVLSVEQIDVTRLAIARIDAAYPGGLVPDTDEPAEAPAAPVQE